MKMEIISEKSEKEVVEHERFYPDKRSKDEGITVPCTEGGLVDIGIETNADMLKFVKEDPNFSKYKVKENRVVKCRPAIGKCSCGKLVILDRSTNTCYSCDKTYSIEGQALKE